MANEKSGKAENVKNVKAEKAANSAATAVAEKPTNATPAASVEKPKMSDEQKAARVKELQSVVAKYAVAGDMDNPECARAMAEISKLKKAPREKATLDPEKAKALEAAKKYFADECKAFAESVNAELVKAYGKLLPDIHVDEKMRLRGVGRSGSKGGTGSRVNMAPRPVHRGTDGKRNQTIRPDGLPSVKQLCAKYPKDAEKIVALLGTGDKRKELKAKLGDKWKETKVLDLSDGTYLTLQS